MPKRFWAILRKEFIQILRDPRTLVLSLIIPVVLLLLFGFAVTFDVDRLILAVIDPGNTSSSRMLSAHIGATSTFDLVPAPADPREAAWLLDSGQANLVVVLPTRMLSNLNSRRTLSVQALVDGSDSTIGTRAEAYLTGAVAGIVSQLTAGSPPVVGRPISRGGIELVPRVLYNPALESRKFFVPGLMVIIIMLVAVLITSMVVVRERERGTLEQLVVSPLRPMELMIGKMLPYGLITFVDVLVVLAVGYAVFGVEIKGSTALLLGLAALFLVGCLGLGLFISVVSSSQQNAFFISMIGTMLPTFVLSGFVFSIPSMPTPIQAFTYLVPARYFLTIARAIILKGLGPEAYWDQIVFLVVFALLTVTLASFRFKKRLA